MAKNLSSASVNFSASAVNSTAAKTKGWMATGYLNLDLTIGSKFRLGAIALTVGSEQHMGLFKGLMGAAKTTILTNVLKQMTLDYNPANTDGVDMSEFGGMDDFEAPAVEETAKEKAIGYLNFSLPIADGELSKLGYIALFASDINHARLNHALSRPGDVGVNNLQLVANRLSATFFPTDLGKTMSGSAAAPAKKEFLALVV